MSDPWETLISVSHVNVLYVAGIERYGGLRGPPQNGCVERSLGAAYMAEIYQDLPARTLGLVFAAGALFYLARNHCFPDGNKRVGWSVMVDLLATRGLTVEATTDEAEALVLSVATGQQTVESVTHWIASRLIAWDPAER